MAGQYERRIRGHPEVREVHHGGQGAIDSLEVRRARHPAIRDRLRSGANLVGRQLFEQAAPTPEYADVWAEKLVRRADQEIAPPGRDVDERVRRMMHGIEEDQRAGLVSESGNLRNGVARADRVGSAANRHELGLRGELALQVVEVQRAVLAVNADTLNGRPSILRSAHPGGDVGIMIELRDDDFIARHPARGERTAQGERQRRHVGAEDDLGRIVGAYERGQRILGVADGRVAFEARYEWSAVVGVAVEQIIADRIRDRTRHLAAGGTVEEHPGPTVDVPGECGESWAAVEKSAASRIGTHSSSSRSFASTL